MDTIKVKILEDGMLQVDTEAISESAHMSADELMEELESLLGGKVERKKKEHPFWKNKNVLRGGKIVKTSN